MPRQAKQKIDMNQLYLYVHEDLSRDYYHIDCKVVAFDNKQKVLLERWDSQIPRELALFSGFLISCQGTNADRADGLYAFRCIFKDVYEITLEIAENMRDILTRVKKGQDAYERDYGYPRSFGQYVGIIARALGFDYFIFDREPTDYNESKFSLDDRRYGITKIDRMVAAWQSPQKEEVEVATE